LRLTRFEDKDEFPTKLVLLAIQLDLQSNDIIVTTIGNETQKGFASI